MDFYTLRFTVCWLALSAVVVFPAGVAEAKPDDFNGAQDAAIENKMAGADYSRVADDILYTGIFAATGQSGRMIAGDYVTASGSRVRAGITAEVAGKALRPFISGGRSPVQGTGQQQNIIHVSEIWPILIALFMTLTIYVSIRRYAAR